MTERYWAIVNQTFAVLLTELNEKDMNRLKSNDIPNHYTAVPVYFTKGKGVWPDPVNECIIVKQVKEDEI